jgi:hypothetical protein
MSTNTPIPNSDYNEQPDDIPVGGDGWPHDEPGGADPNEALDARLAEALLKKLASIESASASERQGGLGEPTPSSQNPQQRLHDSTTWAMVFRAFPPVPKPRQVSSIRFDRDDLKRWNDALESIIAALEAAKFNPNLLYVLYLTLDRLTDDQWARVDKRLFYGEGVHTREGVNNSRDKWQLWPDARKWQRWLELVTEGKILPHEATERFLLSPVFADCPSRVGHNEAWSW